MKKLSIISIAAASLLFANCTKNLDSLNHDPKSASNAVASAQFTQGELNLALNYVGTSVSVAPFRVVAQEWTENTYTYEDNYNFANYNSPNGWWNAMYVSTIHNLELAKQNYPVNFVGAPNQLRNNLIIADILEVYSYNMLVCTFGNIPYSQALNTTIPFPKYDDAKTIFYDLLTRLDTCIAGLDVSQNAMAGADLIYGGDPVQWKKFAASLKLKMALTIADIDPATSKTKVTEAIGAGLFTANTDNAEFAFDAGNPAYSNPTWNALEYSGRHDFGPAKLLVDEMNTLNDPRRPDYFTLYNGAYVGGIAGNPNVYATYSDFGPALYDPKTPGDMLDYAEVEFNLAEAAARGFIGDAPKSHYDSAITASIQFWNPDAVQGDIDTYLAQPGVDYTTAVLASSWQQVIGTQEWIADFNRNWDGWTVIRRLGFPVVIPPVVATSTFPLRFYYPPNETTSNPNNWAAAVKAIPGGADVVTAKLFFMQ
jgi:hypothetical protein